MRTPPSDIETILHFYYSPEPHPRLEAPAIKNAIAGFERDGLLEPTPYQRDGNYHITDKGKAWVEMICATPYPEQVWRNPTTKEVCNEL